MSKKKRSRRYKTIKPASHKRAPSRLVSGLGEADVLMRRKRWDRAREILEDLDRRYPNRIEVLSALVNVYYELHDMRRYLRQHPEIVSLVPLLLDRGDPMGREFATHIARAAGTPEMQAALRDFALSQRGPDEMRNAAARVASEAGLLPPGPVRLWMQGEWREVLLLGFELHSEPDPEHEPQVDRWLTEATLALQRRDADEAERLLMRALEVEPDARDLLNNLAAAYELQGRSQEAEVIVRQLHQRYPDYVFARTSMAQLCISRGEIDEAEAFLKPLLTRQRFHFSEFAAFCVAQIQLFLAQDNPDAARSWFDMWASADPDHYAIAEWRRRLDKAKRRWRPFGRRT